MIYVEKIKVVDNTYSSNKIKVGFEIECKEVNLLVGNQGTGKSTMLEMMRKPHSDLQLTLSHYVKKNGVKHYYFDTEKDNPRIKDPRDYVNIKGEDIGMGYSGALTSRLASHGEIIENLIIQPMQKAKDCIVFIDEPESGLSLTNQFKLIESIKKAVKNNCQIFIATHCYPLIEEFDVISLEHLEQMSGKDFIKKIRQK